MTLDADIVQYICAGFDPAYASTAVNELAASGISGRLARCVVVGAEGSIDRMRELIETADIDYRDVIIAGEYDGALRRVRDLRVSFLINSPEDFWISEVALTAYKHGYFLVNLETHCISTPPFAGSRSYGTATFTNQCRTITIHNRDGQWRLDGHECNPAKFGLDAPLADENRFRIQLDYLLSRTEAEPIDPPKSPFGREFES
ncbi:MAG: hypothetical protein KF851_04630 [Pirellulaceae bacterium]|nr:hypothetical protein [Pirellulaceae bacterium]